MIADSPSSSSTSPLRLHGAARVGMTALFVLLVIVWLLYAVGLRFVLPIQTNGLLCTTFTGGPDTRDLHGLCSMVSAAAEALALLVFAVSSLLLFRSRPDEVVAVVHAGMLLLLSGGLSSVTIGLLADPDMRWIIRLYAGVSVWLTSTSMMIFPDGRFQPSWARYLPIGYGLWVLSWWLIPGLDVTRGGIYLLTGVAIASTIPALAVLGMRRQFLSPTQRQQTKWVSLGAFGAFSLFTLSLFIMVIAGSAFANTIPGMILYLLGVIVRWGGLALIPTTFLISIARYRLWEVDAVIGRAALIGAVTTVLIGIFLGALIVVQQIGVLLVGGDQSNLALAVASLAVAALFNPVRDWLRKSIDARFFPDHIASDAPTTPVPISAAARRAASQATAPSPIDPNATADLADTNAQHDSKPILRDGLTGERFGAFTITSMIGRGGMAEVYRARQTGLNRDVAIKILTAGLADDDQFRARFEREGRTLAGLSHPNIVKVFDAGQVNGTFYIAMEFINGESLAAALAREGALPLERAIPILAGIASALDHAHLHGVIHRDVKPHNIMLQRVSGRDAGDTPSNLITFTDLDGSQPAPETERPILMDFGIARLVAAHTALTGGAGALGTLDYIAPEQIIETSLVDGRADIYSLGVVAYQMLTGRLPFKEANAAAVIMSHLQKPAPDPRAFNPDIPVMTAMGILRAMAKDPDERPDTASAFVEALRGHPAR